MTADQAMDIIQRIAAAYTQFDLKGAIGKRRIELWMDSLANMPYEKVLANLNDHIASNRFAPTIAEISAMDNQSTENEFLKKYEQWEREAKYARHTNTKH